MPHRTAYIIITAINFSLLDFMKFITARTHQRVYVY